MSTGAFLAAFAAWQHASGIVLFPCGRTYRVAESIGGSVRRYYGGRLQAEARS